MAFFLPSSLEKDSLRHATVPTVEWLKFWRLVSLSLENASSVCRFTEEAACPSNLPLMIAAPIRVIPPGRPASRS